MEVQRTPGIESDAFEFEYLEIKKRAKINERQEKRDAKDGGRIERDPGKPTYHIYIYIED